MKPVDASYLLESFVVDPGLLTWEIGPKTSDLVKRHHAIFETMDDDPRRLLDNAVLQFIKTPGSQIGNADRFFGHAVSSGNIARQLTDALLTRHPNLDLPDPQVMRALGVAHDISAVVSRYDGTYKQYDKELTGYFLARHLGVENLAMRAFMHDAYPELLGMIQRGSGFPQVHLYERWTRELSKVKSDLSYWKILDSFKDYLMGEANLPLIVVSVADCCDNGKGEIDLQDINGAFQSRTLQTVRDYWFDAVTKGEEPRPLGIAEVQHGGLARLARYKTLVDDLIHGRDSDQYKEKRPMLWKAA